MTLLQPQTGDIPLPFPSVISRPYWEGCAAASSCSNAAAIATGSRTRPR